MGKEPDRKAFLDELFQFMQKKGEWYIRGSHGVACVSDTISALYFLEPLPLALRNVCYHLISWPAVLSSYSNVTQVDLYVMLLLLPIKTFGKNLLLDNDFL